MLRREDKEVMTEIPLIHVSPLRGIISCFVRDVYVSEVSVALGPHAADQGYNTHSDC